MNLTFTFLTFLFSKEDDFEEMLSTAVEWILKGFLFILKCLISPLMLYQSLKSRKRCPPVKNNLLLLSATELAKKIRAQQITSEEVVTAYITRCREVNPMLNAIVETRFDVAIQEAKEADQVIRSGKKTSEELAIETPLLGIPITVKESIAVQGMSNAAGMKRSKPMLALQDADAVQRVRAAGGIVLLVSNTPEMCMFWETFNNVTGTTLNPYDNRRTSGGSSGGEAALLGAGASLLSLSSDIGGSARLPAMFCGVYGHKPSPCAVSTGGHMPDCYNKNWPNFFTIGPMVRYAEDLPLILETMCQPSGPKLQLNKKIPLNKMKFFFMEDDSGCTITTSVDGEIILAMRRLVQYLNSQDGVTVQEADIKSMKYSFEMMAAILLRLEAESIYMKGTDPKEWKSVLFEVMKYVFLMSPHTLPNILYGVLKKVNDSMPQSYITKLEARLSSLRKEFAELLGDNGVLIYPTFTSAAHYNYQMYSKVANVSYMAVFNSLGLPVTQCPLGLNRNGLPIGLQIIANPGCDHLTITLAQEIEKVFGGWQPPIPNEKPV